MNRVAQALGETFKGYGFALLVFRFGAEEKGRMNYISNAERADMVVALKELISILEGRKLPGGAA
jgi:hypothetical protein